MNFVFFMLRERLFLLIYQTDVVIFKNNLGGWLIRTLLYYLGIVSHWFFSLYWLFWTILKEYLQWLNIFARHFIPSLSSISGIRHEGFLALELLLPSSFEYWGVNYLILEQYANISLPCVNSLVCIYDDIVCSSSWHFSCN